MRKSEIFYDSTGLAEELKQAAIDCSREDYEFDETHNPLKRYVENMMLDCFSRADLFNLCELLDRIQEVIEHAIAECENIDEIKYKE